jgi:hypothetical protein
VPGFSACDGTLIFLQASLKGMLIPVRNLSGDVIALLLRQDHGDAKYLWVSSAGGSGPSPGSPCHVPRGIAAPTRELRVTEGALKADVAYVLSGLPTVGVPGVGNWKNVPSLLKSAGVEKVYISFDMDGKKVTYSAAEALAFRLADMGLQVYGEVWEHA